MVKGIPTAFDHPEFGPILSTIAEAKLPTPRIFPPRSVYGLATYAAAFKPSKTPAHTAELNKVHLRATFYAMCLLYLKKLTTGVNWTGGPRYQQLPKDQWDTRGVFGGYSSDDWVRAMVHYHYAISRRANQVNLFGSQGFRPNPAKPYYIIATDDRNSIISREGHQTSSVNVAEVAATRA